LRVLVAGATGFIGSAVVARLRDDGHGVISVVRPGGASPRRLPAQETAALDIARATRPEDWLPHLAQVDAVVNCAGVLQDSPRDSTAGVHAEGIGALFAACERAGVRRVVHLSAIGIDREAPTAFSRTKLQGDEALMARDLDWVILRPSVVVGRAAYGGSALFRGLAALPLLPVAPETGPLQIVQLDEVVRTVALFLQPGAPARVVLEIAGPQRLSMTEVVQAYRHWLGWPPARTFALPRVLASVMYRLGDLAGALGWRPPMRTTARREIVRGAVGETGEWTRLTGIAPRPLERALSGEGASVQERWFARLYFLKPLIFVILCAFWILTGLISLGPGFDIGRGLMEQGGAGPLAGPSVVAGALADIVVGSAMAFRRTARVALYGALGLSVFYLVAGTILLPSLWTEPLGPMLKIFPIMALHLVALGILEDR
jgi:uncharacterized protein YbjT (DUF2867 family)